MGKNGILLPYASVCTYMYVCVCVCVCCMWVLVWDCACMWRPEVDVEILLSFFLTLILLTLEFIHWLVWPANEFQGSTCLCPPLSLPKCWGCIHTAAAGFCVSSGILNFDTCMYSRHFSNGTVPPAPWYYAFYFSIPEVVYFDVVIENIYFSYCENPITEANLSLDSLSVFIHNY